MNQAALELVRVIVALEQSEHVRSLFHLSHECELDYHWGWRVLRHAEALGYVTVRRSRPGVRLVIRSTERGRAALAGVAQKPSKWLESRI